MRFGLKQQQQCPIGLDLGTHQIKLVQLEQKDTNWRMAAATSRTLPVDLPDAVPQRNDKLTSIIKEALHSSPFLHRRVVSCLPATEIQYKTVHAPQMPPEELRRAVEWEAADRLKLTADQYRIQLLDAGDVRQGEEVREAIIVLAATISEVDEHLDLLTRSNLDPVVIDATPCAMARFMQNVYRDDAEEAPAQTVVDGPFVKQSAHLPQ